MFVGGSRGFPGERTSDEGFEARTVKGIKRTVRVRVASSVECTRAQVGRQRSVEKEGKRNEHAYRYSVHARRKIDSRAIERVRGDQRAPPLTR